MNYDKVCANCNVREGRHGGNDGVCPDKMGRIRGTTHIPSYFIDSGKTRTATCDKNRNPAHYFKGVK